MTLNAYQLDALRDLRISIGELGCIMLDVTSPTPVADVIRIMVLPFEQPQPEARFRHSDRVPCHSAIRASPAGQTRPCRRSSRRLDWSRRIDQDRQSRGILVPPGGRPYSCIVARQLSPSREVKDAHARLSMLPHINTHPDFKPHITLAYVHRDRTQDAVRELRRAFGARDSHVPILFRPTALNYGSAIGGDPA